MTKGSKRPQYYAEEWVTDPKRGIGPTGRIVPLREVLIMDAGWNQWGKATTMRGLRRRMRQFAIAPLDVHAGRRAGPAIDPATVIHCHEVVGIIGVGEA